MRFPDLICLEHFGGNFSAWIEAVYRIYHEQVVRGGLTFQGMPLACKFTPETDGKGFAFWHCVSEQGDAPGEDNRTIDTRRAERIAWIAHAVQSAAPDGPVVWWEAYRGTRPRVVIWIREDRYAVILERRPSNYMLWTTYQVRSGREKAFAAEHAAYWRAQKARAVP